MVREEAEGKELMGIAKRVAKNTLMLTMSNVITKILGLFLVIAITRNLGKSGYGMFSLAFNFAVLAGILADMGLNLLVTREIAKEPAGFNKYLINAIFIKGILGGIALVILFIIANRLGYPGNIVQAILIMSLALVITAISDTIKAIFYGFERMEYITYITIIDRISLIGLSMLVLINGKGILWLSIALLGSSLITSAFSFLFLMFNIGQLKLEVAFYFWKDLIKSAFPFGLMAIFGIICSKIDTILLSILLDSNLRDASIGIYNVGITLVYSLVFIPTVFVGAVFPVFSRLSVSSRNSLASVYQKAFKYLLIVALPIGIGSIILGKEIILFLYGQRFIEAILPFQILMWSIVFIFLGYIVWFVLLSMDKQIACLYIGGGSVILNIVLNLILIPNLSYIGSSIAKVITEGFVFIAAFIYISKHLHRIPLISMSLKPILAGIVMAFFIFWVKDFFHILAVIPLGALIYFSGLVVSRDGYALELVRRTLSTLSAHS